MVYKKLYAYTLAGLAVCTGAAAAVFALCGKMTLPLGVGLIIGAAAAAAAQALFFMAWQSAPNGGDVALFYGMRVAVIALSIIIALIISRPAALGVIIPHLFSTPIIAVTAVFSKEK